MSKKAKTLSVISLCVLILLLISLNISLALFADRFEMNGVIQFKQHKLDVEIVGNDSITLSKEEFTVGSTTTRTINIKNPENSTSCVFRVWLEFYVNDAQNNEYLSLSLPEAQFTLGDDNKFYYNSVLSSGGSVNNLTLTFAVNSFLDAELYQGKTYTMKIFIESLQSTKIALTDWKDDAYPQTWYDSLKNNLA